MKWLTQRIPEIKVFAENTMNKTRKSYLRPTSGNEFYFTMLFISLSTSNQSYVSRKHMSRTSHCFNLHTLVTSRCIQTTMYSHSHTSHNSHHSASHPHVHLSLTPHANFYKLLALKMFVVNIPCMPLKRMEQKSDSGKTERSTVCFSSFVPY